MIERDTIRLLRECDAGVKMGVTAINDVMGSVKDPELKNSLDKSMNENRELAHELQKALADYNDRGKDPDPIAKEMAHLKTGFRLKMSRTDNTVADLVTDGCNMGIKSINRYMNKYKAADERSKNLAKRISDIEENLAFDIRKFL